VEGIFGVGIAEILIIALALFVIGGPENSAKWARQMGRWVRQAREAWSQMMTDMEKDLGPEGKEIMDAARELGRGARDLRTMTPARRMMSETMRQVETSLDVEERAPKALPEPSVAADSGQGAAGSNGASHERYRAWLPPDES
jgi:Sec-independent protein translocase protein TatA